MVQALADAKPDAIFSSLFGRDLARFVREGNTRGLFKGREVFNLLGGEPEYLDPLKDEAPDGWYVTGYPWSASAPRRTRRSWRPIRSAGTTIRVRARWSATRPFFRAVAVMKAAGSPDSEKLVAAMADLPVDMPFGRDYLPGDRSSVHHGRLCRAHRRARRQGRDGRFRYADGAEFSAGSTTEVRKLRPQ